MIVQRLDDIVDTDRDVRAPTWRSRRLLLADGGMGFSLHDTVLYAGTTTEMEYANHLEAVYCIEGAATLIEVPSGVEHRITPGVMYALDAHDRHRVVVDDDADFRVVCAFNPPVTGTEVHDENGAYPAADAEP